MTFMHGIPPPSPIDDLPPMPHAKAVDLLCDEFERQIRAGEQPRIEDYLPQLPESARDFGFRPLLAVELELRWKTGQSLNPDDYRRRFPEHLTVLEAELKRAEQEAAAVAPPSTDKSSVVDTQEFVATASPKVSEDDEPVCQRLGRYQIVRILGEGGFGRVYLAADTQLGRQVALKVPKKKFFDSGHSVEAFLDEARKGAKLKHPGLISVYDVQQEDGRPYIVQEYIEGTNLHRWMREAGASHEQIVTLLIEIAEAVGFLHQQRLVHRDLKPGNILVDQQGHAHVADFGLAVHESSQWQRAGEVAGTWAYMSPEQLRGETHLLDGRSDLWSLGIILYEMLVGRRPFPGINPQDLRDQIRSLEPRPPRQLVPDVSPELERICLKCLQQRRTDRYSSAADLMDDLRHWRQVQRAPSPATTVKAPKPDQPTAAPRIVPKGLRSFDEHDADFFLELLPGARDRDGLPDSIRFWKTRIEAPDPDQTFSVGLIYGPSGCGKSSLVKAGLLPRLASQVVAVYVEATADDTEVRLLKGLKKRLPHLPDASSLPKILQRLRERGLGGGRKLLIVLDQFEQWLHTHGGEDGSQLVEALRHCDGGNVQCVVLVRDDFWMPATRFMRAVEAKLLEGHNSNPVDLFPVRHAEEVLTKFGRAFRTLPENFADQLPEQSDFVRQSVSGLAHDGKVICVRLSLFADMMKGKPWTPASLKEVGGMEGVGVTFLDEMFSASTSPPEHRLHQKAARAILKSLLPELGTDIKGNMRSYDDLLTASGYAQRPREFADLMQILDSELRLITPTDPDGVEGGESRVEGGRNNDCAELPPWFPQGIGDASDILRPTSPTTHHASPATCYFQLTHDYLVPSLREWLTRKQRETRRGRAELRLAERAALWSNKPEKRYLPGWWEYLNIAFLVPARNWTGGQRRMMKAATRNYGIIGSFGLVTLLIAALGLHQFLAAQQRDSVRRAVDALQSTIGVDVVFAIRELAGFPQSMVLDELRTRTTNPEEKRKLPFAYALASLAEVDVKFLIDAIRTARAEECDNLVVALAHEPKRAVEELRSAAAKATAKQDWALKTRLATVALYLGDPSIAAEMLQTESPPGTSEPLRDWHDSPFDSTWEEVPADTGATIAAAHGMVADRFAFCQDMPWDTFLTTIETLRPCGYRPTRVRPYAQGNQRLVAALWTRDGRRWQLDRDQTAEQLPSPDSSAVRDGMLPEDVASYATASGTLLHILLWCESGTQNEERRLMVGMMKNDLAEISRNMTLTKFTALKTLQLILENEETRRYAGIWSNQGTVANAARFDSHVSVDLSLGSQLERVRQLAAQGYRPLGIATQMDSVALQIRLTMLWHRPHLPHLADVKWDPIQRTMFIEHFPSWPGDIRKLVDMLGDSDDAALRSGISLAIGSQLDASAEGKEVWGQVLENWHLKKPDSGTHSAAGWALRSWGLPLPELQKHDDKFDWQIRKLGLTMLRIPIRKFLGQDEDNAQTNPQAVTVSEFWLADREVTVAQFQQFIEDEDYRGEKPSDWQGVDKEASPTGDHPVQQVSWYDAVMFCNWLSWKEGFSEPHWYHKTGAKETIGRKEVDVWQIEEKASGYRGYRLPLAAEWEYACRAGITTRFGSGEEVTMSELYCVYNSRKAEKVGSKLCNGWGLFDMHGNVDEWCQVSQYSHQLTRGGAWSDFKRDGGLVRDSYVARITARDNRVGFRVALVKSR